MSLVGTLEGLGPTSNAGTMDSVAPETVPEESGFHLE